MLVFKLIVYQVLNIIRLMQQILSRYARFVQQTTIKSRTNYQLASPNLPFMQPTRPMHFTSSIMSKTKHSFCQKKPDEKEKQHNDNPHTSGTNHSIDGVKGKQIKQSSKESQQGSSQEHTHSRKNETKFNRFMKTILWLIFGGGTIFFVEFQKVIIIETYERYKQRYRQSQEIRRGKYIQKRIIEDLEREYIKQKEIDISYIDKLTYFNKLQNIISVTSDEQAINLIASHAGNEFGTNLKRLINQRMHLQQPAFKKFYYLNLSNPPIYKLNRSDEGKEWQEVRELHYLLTYLTSNKGKPTMPNILVIDEAQVLYHFFKDKQKQEILRDVFKKIFQLQKANTKVIVIHNSQIFGQKLSNFLINIGNLKLTSHLYINKLNREDLSKIFHSRIISFERKTKKIDSLYTSQSQRYYEIIIKHLLDSHDNINEINKIISGAYQTLQKNISSQRNRFGQIMIKISDKIIEDKGLYIQKIIAFGRIHHSLSGQQKRKTSNELKQKDLINEKKCQLLQKIFQKGYGFQKSMRSSLLQRELQVDLSEYYTHQAWLDLNRDKILHGLVFADRLTFLAYSLIIQNMKDQKGK